MAEVTQLATPNTAHSVKHMFPPLTINTHVAENDDGRSIARQSIAPVALPPSELQQLFIAVCDQVYSILKKNKDATKLIKSLNDVKDAYLANVASLSHHLETSSNVAASRPTSPTKTIRPISPTKSVRSTMHSIHYHPTNPDEVESNSLLAHWVNEFRSAVVNLQERCQKVKAASLMTSSAKRKKLEKGIIEVTDCWNNLMMNLSIAISRSGTSFAANATEQVAKLALASGNPDWEDLDLEDADILVLQGDKYMLGFGVRKDPETAYRRYEAASRAGHPQALNMLGLMNELGIGRARKDIAAAASFYEQAAGEGDATALTALGRLYEGGVGIPQDMAKARECYQRAAEKGEPEGMCSLGMALERGLGDLHPNPSAALRWYTLAADQFNHPRAATAAGCILYKGHPEIQPNAVEAVKYFRQAAERGNEHAMNSLGVAYEDGCGVSKDLGLAKDWYLKASEKGSADALSNLGNIYLTEKYYQQAFKVFQLAWSMGSVEAAYGLGTMYQNGCKEGATSDIIFLRRDIAMAVRFFTEAASRHHLHSCLALAKIYLKPTMSNPTKAYTLIRQAATEIPEAMYLLGHLYETGTGCGNVMIDQAVVWYKRAIEANERNGCAMLRLGMLLERGTGVSMNMSYAAELYEEAARKGNVDAKERLEALKRVGLA
ncbi:hypothetical protein SmJEL517_g03298 [Synchytrium microbalum]|uniref:Uncharacterized protein n=1 Tax=Synchytrium microbalum TaxID=1806994 RepID=A0A507C3F0_9FUNG|nr:uncharacterized protein SmJEL517_g03298 [Synchytrium microbalum]TPX33908.1 hypothetical protein SmJEL517_g03298 [Synchytrium microbalum]